MRLLGISYIEQTEEKHIMQQRCFWKHLEPCFTILVPKTECTIRASAGIRAMYLKCTTRMMKLVAHQSTTCKLLNHRAYRVKIQRGYRENSIAYSVAFGGIVFAHLCIINVMNTNNSPNWTNL